MVVARRKANAWGLGIRTITEGTLKNVQKKVNDQVYDGPLPKNRGGQVPIQEPEGDLNQLITRDIK